MRKCKCIKSISYNDGIFKINAFIIDVVYYYVNHNSKGLNYPISVSQVPMTVNYFNEHFIDIEELRNDKINLILFENGKV